MNIVDLQPTVVLESIIYENYAQNLTNALDAPELLLTQSPLISVNCFCGGTSPQSFTLSQTSFNPPRAKYFQYLLSPAESCGASSIRYTATKDDLT